MAYLTNFSFEKLQEMSCMLTVNDSYGHVFDLSHTGAAGFGRNWNPSGIYAERDLLPDILSCHCLQSNIVTR